MKKIKIKPLFLYSTIVAFTFISCTKEDEDYTSDETEYTSDETEYPSNYTLDINQDGIEDFVVEYNHISTSDVPVSAISIIGSITPLDNVSCLYQAYDGHLFLSPNDTIHSEYTSQNQWSSYDADIITKDWHRNIGWGTLWEVRSSQNEYYFAFKLQNGVTNELGWLKLEIDLNTGDIEITDMASSNSDFIVI